MKRKIPKFRGTVDGVSFAADVTVPRDQVTLLAAKLAPLVRGKALPGAITLTFPAGPGTEKRIAVALKALEAADAS